MTVRGRDMAFRWVLAVIVCICAASRAGAQDVTVLPSRVLQLPPLVVADDGVSPAERVLAVEEWTREYQDWKSWHQRWRNKLEPGWFSARARRQPPTPPAWLAASCAVAADQDPWLGEACRDWREWVLNDDSAELVAQQVAQARTSHEAPIHTLWWERVHMDALWPMTQSGSSAIGVAGTHATFHVTKRFQIFMAPGLILVRLPVLGRQTWSAATDWGFSYRLFDFRLPGVARPSTAHFNIARVWVFSAGGQPVPGELYLAGLSLTFKQR